MSQVVRALLGVSTTTLKIRDVAARAGEGSIGIADTRRQLGCSGKRIENAALRVTVEQRLRLMLSVQVDQQPPDLSENSCADAGSVHPRARPARGGDFTLEDDEGLLRIDAALVEQRGDLRLVGDVEHTFYRRALGAGTDEIRARALAEQQP